MWHHHSRKYCSAIPRNFIQKSIIKTRKEGKMSTYNPVPLQNVLGNPVISITNGEMIAKVVDIRLDPQNLKAALVITSKGGLFKGKLEAIPAEKVDVWGRDALLVNQSDVLLDESDFDVNDSWLSGSDDIRGYDVINQDGTRIGKLADVVLDTQGKVRGYRMGEVFIEGKISETHWIDVEATHSLGSDVLILKPEYSTTSE
jgi:sporulation protein YlmC with PRC-barrel domain